MRYSILLVLLAMGGFVGHESKGQTPQVAVRYYRAGQEKMKSGDWDAADDNFTKAIAANARLKTTHERFDDSQSRSNEISVSDPFTANAYLNRGAVRFHQAKFAKALADYDRAIRVNPKLAQAYVGRGASLYAQGDRGGAARDFDRALALDDRLLEAYKIGRIHRYASRAPECAITNVETCPSKAAS